MLWRKHYETQTTEIEWSRFPPGVTLDGTPWDVERCHAIVVGRSMRAGLELERWYRLCQADLDPDLVAFGWEGCLAPEVVQLVPPSRHGRTVLWDNFLPDFGEEMIDRAVAIVPGEGNATVFLGPPTESAWDAFCDLVRG